MLQYLIKSSVIGRVILTWLTNWGIYLKNSIKDAYTPQSGEIVFNLMRYRSSETVQRFNSKMTALISKLKIMKL